MLAKIRGIKQTTVKGRRYYYHRASGQRIEADPGTAAFLTEIVALDQGSRPEKKSRAVGIHRVLSKGHVYYYHRATGDRIEAPPGTPAFTAKVRALNAGGQVPRPVGTWSELAADYLASPEFAKLGDRTKLDYEKVLVYLASLGEMPLLQFTPAACLKIRDKAFADHKRRFANYVVQVLSVVFAWGRPRDFLQHNPASGLKIETPSDAVEANRSWTDDEQKVVISEARGSLKLAIALGMFASMRGGDIVRAEWSAYDGMAIQWRAGKNDLPIWKPARRMLREILDAAPRLGDTIVAGPDGRPWTEGTLRKHFRTLIARLEREERVAKGITLHGLRTTNATRLADLGADIRAIQAELGDRSTAMGFHYSRSADMKRAAETATRLLDNE